MVRRDFNATAILHSGVLANIGKWPGVLIGERMVAFAKAAVPGRKSVDRATSFDNLHDVVAASSDHWEQTNATK